jgi:hypothetical protein
VTYRGKVRNGAIVLEPGIELPEGAQVRIELDSTESTGRSSGSDPLFRMTDLAVETGVPDLATNIDHYLYGHPKQSDAG